MERTRTTGISIEAGCRIIDKRYKGQRIYARLGEVSQEEAEAYLAKRINEVRAAKLFGESPRRTFREAAMKHLLEEKQRLAQKFRISSDGGLRPKGQKQLDDKARHLKLLDRFVGHLALDEICDDTLEPFISQRHHDGVAAKTVRLSLEQVRRILNKAARTWRKNNQPWLRLQPPVITMPKGEPRAPFPITRAEERALFSELPLHLADMCLFKVNTGLREAEVCELRWEWERKLDDGISVFLIPPAHHKGGDYNRYRLVVPNSIARAVIEAQRGTGIELDAGRALDLREEDVDRIFHPADFEALAGERALLDPGAVVLAEHRALAAGLYRDAVERHVVVGGLGQ